MSTRGAIPLRPAERSGVRFASLLDRKRAIKWSYRAYLAREKKQHAATAGVGRRVAVENGRAKEDVAANAPGGDGRSEIERQRGTVSTERTRS